MITNEQLYQIASKHIGEGGSKARKYCGMSSGPWCNAYVCYIANEGGVKKLYFNGAKETYCPHSIEWCKANLAHLPIYLAMPMDILYMDWQPNGRPDHIGFAKKRKSSSEIYTHEGNTNGGVVAEKVRTVKYCMGGVYRPKFTPATLPTKAKLKIDGQFDYSSIYMLQLALGLKGTAIFDKATLKALQKKAGATADGDWGTATSKKVQKMIGVTVDGEFGINSVKALQKWINNQVFPSR